MKKVCILDSWGEERLHGAYTDLLGHVEFVGYTPPQLRGVPLHGHGSWCAWDWASQKIEPVMLFMNRIFNTQGSGESGVWDYAFAAMRDHGPFDFVSCSWSAQHPFSQLWREQFLEACGGATIVMSTGNAGYGQISFPQYNFRFEPQVKIIGSCDKEGRRSYFSETAGDDDKYADVLYLGEGLSLDGRTAEVLRWRGTSKSDPNGGGDLWARGLDWLTADAYWRKRVLEDNNANGIPDGIHPDFADLIEGGGFHPDVGIGVAESGRQFNMRESGLGLNISLPGRAGIVLNMPCLYHDMDRLSLGVA